MTDGPNVVIRGAQPGDLDAVAAFTSGTFEWGDYVTDSFLEWLDNDQSSVLVAERDGDVVAMCRVVLLAPREIWLHAARVHSEHRRQGIGRVLNEASLQWGRARGAVVARLMVEESNEAAQLQVEAAGYRRVAEWFHATKSVLDTARRRDGPGLREPEPLRPAPAQEVDGAYMSWSTSELARAAHGLIGERWHMRHMTVDDVYSAVRDRALWEAPSGWVMIQRDGEDSAWVPWLMTTAGEADTLVETLLTKLRGDGVATVSVLLPRTPWLVAAFEASRFSVHANAVWELAID